MLYDQLVAHARERGCRTSAAGSSARATASRSSFYPARNLFESPLRFEIHPDDQFRITTRSRTPARRWAIYHSHPKTEALPSQTDVNLNAIAEVAGPARPG